VTIAATFTETRDNWGSIMPCYIMHELDIGLGITRYLISMKDYVSDDCLIHDAEYSAKAHCYFLIRVLLYPLHEMRILPLVHRSRYHVVNFHHSSAFKA